MKTILLVVFLPFLILSNSNQAKQSDTFFICDTGKIHFLASTPLEDIEATSNKTACVFNLKTKEIEAKVEMKTFEFRRKKMQDDFNEDYIESDKFPYAVFNATITNNVSFGKDGTYDVKLKGMFEIHGVKRQEEVTGKLTIRNGQPANATATFDVRLADYNIKIPTIVVLKIAEVVKVDVNLDFKKR
jgi:polyisoprenoid-binding protein YceI